MSDLDLIVERLEMRGHRLTPSRRAVLKAVIDSAPHFTPEELLHRLPQVGRATVFRTLRLLLDLNVVCRVLMEDGSLRYRPSPLRAGGHHHHLVCTQCGRVEDFTRCDVSALVDELAQSTEYDIEGHWLEVYGRCASCRPLQKVGGAL